MSGYPDDRYDDDRRDEARPADPRAIAAARSLVTVPATLLIVTGVLLLLLVILAFIQLPSLPGKMNDAIAEVDADPNLPADQKDFYKKIFGAVKENAENPATPYAYGLTAVFALLIAFGGVKLMKLSGPTFPIIGSVLAMIPCTSSCCCLLGLPAGIWALVVINRPMVKAAFAAARAGQSVNPDDQYMR
jgi:hypothetical protein